MAEEAQTIVLVNGSSSIKAGFAGEENPRSVFPSIVGHLKYSPPGEKKDFYVGEEALGKSGILILKYPIIHGLFQDWGDVEKLWRFTFDELKVDTAEHPILFTEPRINPKEARAKMAQIIFETFKVPSLYLEMQPVLSLYAAGQSTGIILESGDTTTNIVPIKDGRPIINSISHPNLAGRDVSSWFNKILGNTLLKVDKMKATGNVVRINDIKKKCSYISLDYDTELQKAKTSHDIDMSYTYEKTGEQFTIADERFRGPELLFKPNLNDLEVLGFHTSIVESINKCEKEVQKDLYSHIFVSGGNTLFPGFPERLEKEIKCLAPEGTDVKVSRVEGKFPSWKGGSLLAMSETFKQKAITAGMYREVGPDIVNQKST